MAKPTGTADLFSYPDSIIKEILSPKASPRGNAKRTTAKKAKPAAPAGQSYLPGLSRRGRPRLKDAPPATVRAAESRKRRVAAGLRRIELMLSPETAAQLDRLVRQSGETRAELIGRLIGRAARRLKAPANGDAS